MPRRWTATDSETWMYMGQIYSSSIPICDVAGSNYIGVFGIGEPGVNGEGVFFAWKLHALSGDHRRLEQHAVRR